MSSTLTQSESSVRVSDRGRGPIEGPLRVDAEAVMNTIALVDDAVRALVKARKTLVANLAQHNRRSAA